MTPNERAPALDLEGIRRRWNDANHVGDDFDPRGVWLNKSWADIPALLAEIERLRPRQHDCAVAEIQRLRTPAQQVDVEELTLRKLASDVFDEAKGSFSSIDTVQDIIEAHLRRHLASTEKGTRIEGWTIDVGQRGPEAMWCVTEMHEESDNRRCTLILHDQQPLEEPEKVAPQRSQP